MNCFVIMPFTAEFDDVYAVIKQTVENATNIVSGRCFRLDETRPAGRITERLLNELRAATFCVADLTGNRPNVMWEIGFAMALEKPIIIITQNLDELPFDIKDMQSIQYSRNHLSTSLANPLKKMIIDTIAITSVRPEKNSETSNNSEAVGMLMKEVAQLKEIVFEAVNVWKNNGSVISQPVSELKGLCGHWLNTESGSHGYARIIHGKLVAPYCYMGNTDLTGVFYDWRRTGDYWFARYIWMPIYHSQESGFSFLKQESYDTLKGAWWSSEEEVTNLDSLPSGTGVPATWERQNESETPLWAENFFKKVEIEGLPNLIAHGYG